MRVRLSHDLFPDPPSSVHLHAIAALALDGRHRLWVEDDTSPEFATWFNGLSQQQQDEWQLIIDEGYGLEAREPALRDVVITRANAADWQATPPRLPLADALTYLAAPFRALLEDWSSDHGFLMAVALPEERRLLESLTAKGALVFENGGGITNMPRKVAAIAGTPGGALRLWVMFDGDAMQPNVWSADAARLFSVCEEHQVPRKRLTRRCIENYLPLETLHEWADRPGAGRTEKIRSYRAFVRLEARQRNHFNMKDGFDQDAKRTDATAGDLYEGIQEHDRRFLAKGFGGDIAKLFVDIGVNEAQLTADGSWDELSEMVGTLIALVR